MNFKDINYSNFEVKDPYPEVDIKTQLEPDVISLLIASYSGIKGEATAIFQYSYQSFLTKPTYEDLHEILEKVSINEMVHLQILSQVLLSQKIDPRFCRYIDNNSEICEAWSTNAINYEKNITSFLEYNIKLEQMAIDTYNEIIKKTKNAELKNIINRILKDEKAHVKIFNKLLSVA